MELRMYKEQLEQVNEALKQNSDESDIKDLLQLREDLTQLISLTEESSASGNTLKDESNPQQSPALDNELSTFYNDIAEIENMNAKLVSTDNETTVREYQKSPFNEELASFYSEIEGELNPQDISKDRTLKSDNKESPPDPLNEEFLDVIENLNDISGVKCQAPFTTEWSGSQYHNAMIKGPAGKADGGGDIKVKVLFLNPTMRTMQPCPYYLDGECKFDVTQCRYSHGHVVSIYDLRPYVTPEYSNLVEGSKCLARMADGIWKSAVIEKLEDHFYHVKFFHKDLTLALELHNLLPQIDHRETERTLSDGDEDIVAEITPSSQYSKYGECSSSDSQSIGLWEEHTRGIGSKLMRKMGYKPGQGLGKLSQGRVELVPIVLLPPGKSLDHCMKIKEEKGVKAVNGRGDVPSGDQMARRKRRRGCIFSFLNKTLGDNGKVASKKEVEKTKDLFGIKEGKDKKTTKNFNKEMLKNEEEMKKIQSKIQKVKESLGRNPGNTAVVKLLKQKLENLEGTLKSMKEYDSNIKLNKTRMETHRKMTVF